MNRPAIVIDPGSGYTKMGYSGNPEPSHIIPTLIGARDTSHDSGLRKQGVLDDLDFYIGEEAILHKTTHPPVAPIRHGLVEDWDMMERFYEQALFKYLRCEPEEHNFMITEAPRNTPENREYLAELMFETFNVKGMYIAVQAVLALVASWSTQTTHTLTGTVIDSGDGVTHIIPVSDGYMIPSAIKHIPLAGKDITKFIMEFIRDREKDVIPPEDAMEVARKIKEQHCYVCRDLVTEYKKYDTQGSDKFRRYEGFHPVTKQPYAFDIGYERFLGPELYFNPEIFSAEFTKTLPDLVDETILACPIDTRRSLYRNIVLSGGSTMFHNFSRRLKDAIKEKVDDRTRRTEELTKAKSTPIEVNVVSHEAQHYAVWFGGSYMADQGSFQPMWHTKAQYDEVGPSLCRHNATFTCF